MTSKETVEQSSEKAHHFPKILLETSPTVKYATNDSTESADQNSTPKTFTQTEISSPSSHDREISRNNPKLRVKTDLEKKA